MHAIEELLRVMAALRDPDSGCPWDLRQDFESIVPHTLEEAYEVAEAIETGAFGELKLELGDLLFQVVFYARLADEAGMFDFDDVVAGITEKLINRHPHVFESTVYADVHEQSRAWEQFKKEEQAARGLQNAGTLDGVSKTLPALTRAFKIQRKAARVGFDWAEAAQVLAKLDEERQELDGAMDDPNDRESLAEEMGDLLFTCVNLARHLELDPEQSLRSATRKFERRFSAVEARVRNEGGRVDECTQEHLEALWEAVKSDEEQGDPGHPA